MTAITAITAQNTKGVYDIHSIPLKSLEKQIMVTCNDIKPDAIKIGMLHSSEVINIVEKCLSKNNNFSLDMPGPVMIKVNKEQITLKL